MHDIQQVGTADLLKQPTKHDPRRIIITGLGILALFFGVFVLWATLTPLHSAVMAQADVIFDSRRKTVQHLEGGIVKQIMVKDGDTVKAGQPLILLDDNMVRPVVSMLEGQTATEIATMARLEAEKNDLPNVVFPKGLPVSAVQNEGKLFTARREAFQSQIKVLISQIDQTREGIKGLQEQRLAKEQELSTLKEQLAANQILQKDGYVTKTIVLELQRLLAQKVGEREQISAAILSNQQRLVELEQRIVAYRTDRIQNAVAEMKQSAVKRLELEERVRPSRDTLERQVIRAPVSGKVVDLKVTTVGGVIAGKEPLMDIVPQADSLVLEAKIGVNDINDVKIGQVADVTLTAYKASSTPTVKAVVSYIAADRQITHTFQGDMPYYAVRLEIDQKSMKEAGNLKLYPGMMAQISIQTHPRTAFDYFIGPLKERMGRAFHEK